MYSRILDLNTLGAVIAAGPEVDEPVAMAQDVLDALETAAAEGYAQQRITRGGMAFWAYSIAGLADMLDCTPRKVGQVLRDLGFLKVRYRDGFWFFWNEAQVRILKAAIGGKDERSLIGYLDPADLEVEHV